jgi:hypothetical protein
MSQWFKENWQNVLTVAGLVVGILGLIGLYFGYKGWKRKKLTYLIRSNNYLSGLEHAVPDVEVKFAGYGSPIKALTITKIGFWNGGNDTIKKQEIVKGDPLAIRAKEGVVILATTIVAAVNQLNMVECTVTRDRSQADITFDYLDPNQGAIVQVFHTVTSDNDLKLVGTIMGPVPIKRLTYTPPPANIPPWAIVVLLAIGWIIWLLLVTGVVERTPPPAPHLDGQGQELISVEALGIGFCIITVLVLLVLYLIRIPKPFVKITRDKQLEPIQIRRKTEGT